MKIIILTQGKFATVDDDDYDRLNEFNWQAVKLNHTYYAVRTDRSKIKRTIRMHREILNIHDSKIQCDHIDHNGLNNQKSNLRICTPIGNSSNISVLKGSYSKYLGVTLKIDKRFTVHKIRWYAQIRKNGKTYFLGSFPYTLEGEIQAAKS